MREGLQGAPSGRWADVPGTAEEGEKGVPKAPFSDAGAALQREIDVRRFKLG